MSKLAKTFRDLDVYKIAYQAALDIYELSKKFPADEKYSLTDQIRRSSRSVCTHIGEAWALRKYEKHFASKLTVAISESTETQVHLDFSKSHFYITKDEHARLDDVCNHISAMLANMIEDAASWCS